MCRSASPPTVAASRIKSKEWSRKHWTLRAFALDSLHHGQSTTPGRTPCTSALHVRHGLMRFRIDELAVGRSRGFESLFVPEHTQSGSRRTPFPSGEPLRRSTPHLRSVSCPSCRPGGDEAPPHRHRDLSHRARHVSTTPRSVASLDLLSGETLRVRHRRGWNAEEMENHGTTSDALQASRRAGAGV